MNRRQIIAALPLTGLATAAMAQPPTAGRAPAAPAAPVEPTLPQVVLAQGLKFPEGPVVMNDGSVLFVEIPRKTITKLAPDGALSVVAQLEGGPNGLAVGPDKALYIANNGGRFSFTDRGGSLFPGGAPPGFTGGGLIQKMDLRTKRVTPLFTEFEGKTLIAPDDLVFDKAGGLWITEYGVAAGTGAIYYAAPGAKALTLARGGMSSPNGLGVSPDGKFLHVSMGRQLMAYDIVGPGKLATNTYPGGVQGPLNNNGTADSLKIQADGRVVVCTLLAPGGIGVHDRAGKIEFFAFNDRMTCNIAFGGPDMRSAWVMLSGLGQIVKVRWPYAGQTPAFRA